MTDYEKEWKKFERDLRNDAKIYVAGCKQALQTLNIPKPDHNIHKEFFIGNYTLYDGEKKYTLMDQARYVFLREDNHYFRKWRERLEDMHHADDATAGFDEYANELQQFVENFSCFHNLQHARTMRSLLKSIYLNEDCIQKCLKQISEHRIKLKEYLQKHDIDLDEDMPSYMWNIINNTLYKNQNYVSKRIMAYEPKSDL